MTNKETIERNIGLTVDFVNYLIDNPSVVEDLPEKFTLEFIEKDFPNLEKKQSIAANSGVNLKFARVRNSFELTK